LLSLPGDPIGGCKVAEEEGELLYSLGVGESCGLASILAGGVTWQDWYARRGGITSVSAGPLGARVAVMPERALLALYHRHPIILARVAASTLPALGPLAWYIGLAIECIEAPAGHTVVREGDKCHSMYVVLHGRLRVSRSDPESSRRLLPHRRVVQEELTRGMKVGAGEVLLGGVHTGTMSAVRDSDLASIHGGALAVLMARLPSATMGFARSIASGSIEYGSPGGGGSGSRRSHLVAVIVPLSSTYPTGLFAQSLQAALLKSCDGRVLSSGCIDRELSQAPGGKGGRDAGDVSMLDKALGAWMSRLEDRHSVVIYVADAEGHGASTGWDTLCVRQADLVLLVGNAADKPLETLPCESLLEIASTDTNARQELVLLHLDPGTDYSPSGTRHWIQAAPRERDRLSLSLGALSLTFTLMAQALKEEGAHVQHHHHMRMHTTDPEYDRHHFKSDFLRISRWLSHSSVGLVLGGGGARGLAHLTVLQTLEAEGIPVDMIGGTSMGSLVAALYAVEPYGSWYC